MPNAIGYDYRFSNVAADIRRGQLQVMQILSKSAMRLKNLRINLDKSLFFLGNYSDNMLDINYLNLLEVTLAKGINI